MGTGDMGTGDMGTGDMGTWHSAVARNQRLAVSGLSEISISGSTGSPEPIVSRPGSRTSSIPLGVDEKPSVDHKTDAAHDQGPSDDDRQRSGVSIVHWASRCCRLLAKDCGANDAHQDRDGRNRDLGSEHAW